jgi:S1-C subfamily serine protease
VAAGDSVTNAHVVEGTQTITIVFSDGTEQAATLIGTDAG